MDAFKKQNSRWEKIRVVMADKDIGEQDVIKKCLPCAKVLICLFHSLCTFHQEVSCDKLGITSGARVLFLVLMQKVVYAKSEAEYDSLYAQLQKDVPKQVVEYFDECWHTMWLGLCLAVGRF